MALNEHLSSRTFMVGNYVSLADISLVCTLIPCFRYYFDENMRNRIPCVFRLVNFLVN